MPSGKKARQQRQQAAVAPPPVRSKGAPGGTRQASPRALAIAGGVILVVIVAVVLAIVLSQKSSGSTTGDGSGDGPNLLLASGTPATGSSSSASALAGSADVAKLLKGIPQKGFVLGNPNAPVQLTEFIDLQCPACQYFETQQFPTLVAKYVRPGKLSIKMQPWRILDRTSSEFDSLRGQKATIAAAAQNKAFTFAEVLYDNQGSEGTGWMNDAMISNIAASVDGLKTSQLISDANSSATQKTITAIDQAGAAGQFSATPTILLSRPPDKPHVVSSGAPDLPTLEGQIDALLKK